MKMKTFLIGLFCCMSTYRLYTLFFCFITLITTGSAQIHSSGNKIHISGKVSDLTDNQALVYATVRLLQQDSTFVSGTITDSLGYYKFDNLVRDSYLLSFSMVGYKQRIIQIAAHEDMVVPDIKLESESVTLGEVIVKGSSFIRQKDKVLILPDKQQVKHSGTGYDLLYSLMIPGLEVDRHTGVVSTLGGSVTLYINGEKAEFRDVQLLRPKDVEKVEYYDVPSGKYVRDVAAINYITKKNAVGGYVGVDGKQKIGYLAGDYNVSTKVNKGDYAYTLFAGYNMENYGGMQSEKQEYFNFPGYTLNRSSKTQDAKTANNQQYIQLKASQNTEKKTLSAQIGLVHNNTPENSSYDLLAYTGKYTSQQESGNVTTQKNLKPSFKLYGNFNLSEKQTLNLTTEGYYTRNTYNRVYTEGEERSLTCADEDLYWLACRGNYDISLGHQNNVGINFEHYHSITSSSYTGDYNVWQHLWMGETMLYTYYQQRFGNKWFLNLSPGVSILNYKYHGDDLQQHWSFRLYSNLVYNINEKHTLMLMFAIGNEQADISYINDIDQTIDFLQVKRGNTDLANTKIYVPAIGYQAQVGKLNLETMLMYWGYFNNITFDYYPEGDRLVNTYRSDADFHSLTAQLSATYRFSDNLRLKLKGEYTDMKLTGVYAKRVNAFSGSIDVNYYWKDFSLNVYGRSTSRQLNQLTMTTLKNPAVYGLSLSWSHGNWMAEAGTENPFTKQSHYYRYADCGAYRFSQLQTSRIYQQTAYIKLAYTFDFGKKTSRENNNVDRSINSAILKAR